MTYEVAVGLVAIDSLVIMIEMMADASRKRNVIIENGDSLYYEQFVKSRGCQVISYVAASAAAHAIPVIIAMYRQQKICMKQRTCRYLSCRTSTIALHVSIASLLIECSETRNR